MARTPISPEERLRKAQALGIIVDAQDEWLLSAFTWCKIGRSCFQTTIIRNGKRSWSYLSHMIMGEPPPGKQWRRHRCIKHDYRRANFYLAAPYRASKTVQAKKDAARERRLLKAVRTTVDVATGDGSGCGAGRVGLHTSERVRHLSNLDDRALWPKQDDVEQRSGDGT